MPFVDCFKPAVFIDTVPFWIAAESGSESAPNFTLPGTYDVLSGIRAATVYEVSISACPLFAYEIVYVSTPPGGCGWLGSGETEMATVNTGMFVVVVATMDWNFDEFADDVAVIVVTSFV